MKLKSKTTVIIGLIILIVVFFFYRRIPEFSSSMSSHLEYLIKKNSQDMSVNCVENSLKNLSNFTFFSITPLSYNDINSELKKYGNINGVKIIDLTDESIKFNDIDSDATILFEVKDVFSCDGKELPFVRASLNVQSRIVIKKNTEDCSAYIWSKNCFLPGNLDDKNTKDLVIRSLASLMNIFIENYSLPNPGKPTFNLVSK